MAGEFKAVAKGRWADGSGESRNIFYGQCTTGDDDRSIAVAAAWIEAMWDNITPIISVNHSIYSVELYYYEAPGEWVFHGEQATTLVGTSIASPLPHQIAPLVVARTNHKRTQGRKYIAGVVEDRVLDGRLDTTAKASLTVFLDAWMFSGGLGPSTVDVNGGVIHIESPIQIWHPFIGGRVDEVVATQRRRKPGVGI